MPTTEQSTSLQRIHRLEPIVAERIAAGEVVLHPASVVKELIENAIDSGARRIDVSVENGGIDRLEVRDNGCGIHRDDLLLAVDRHATSKITHSDDLQQVCTLGFRGEALSSIAAVSRFTLSSSNGGQSGGRLLVHGGRILRHEDAGVPQGTNVRVEDLFYGVPARRKFLKTPAYEFGRIHGLFKRYAMAFPEVQLSLFHNSRRRAFYPTVNTQRERIVQVLGDSWREHSDVVEEVQDDRALTIFFSRNPISYANSRQLFFYLNRRIVFDRTLVFAVQEAYRNYVMTQRYPGVVLFLEMPPESFDVNIHPAKEEVRFRQSQEVLAWVRRLLRDRLAEARLHHGGVPYAPAGGPSTEGGGGVAADSSSTTDGAAYGTRAAQIDWSFLGEPAPFAGGAGSASGSNAGSISGTIVAAVKGVLLDGLQSTAASSAAGSTAGSGVGSGATTAADTQAGLRFADLRPIGQYRASYILCEAPHGLVIIDQHAAHERVRFERLRARFAAGPVSGQQLLEPLMVTLDAQDAALMPEVQPHLEALGFELEHFGDDDWLLRAVPQEVSTDGRALLRDILALWREQGNVVAFDRLRDRLLATVACHGAIRFNQRLQPEEIVQLLSDLDQTPGSTHCPHGRPVFALLDNRRLEATLGRG